MSIESVCGRASTHFYLMPSGRVLGCCSDHGYGYERADLVIPVTEAELCAMEVHAA